MATTAIPAVVQPMLGELRSELAITKRVLGCVPPDKLTWKPHAKSMTLGQLAGHIAGIPGRIAKMAQQDSFDVLKGNFVPAQPSSREEILSTFEQSAREADEILQGLTDERAQQPWRLMRGDQEVFAQPRSGVLRTILLNHMIHHRGQLSVYLRLLDVPLPVIYGRSADTDPFA